MPKSVVIQGIRGSYHEIAARRFFDEEEINVISKNTFREVIETVRGEQSYFALMAIENTIAGSLLKNHELIRESGLFITGEYKLRISHCLAALPGTALEEITEVASHPMALSQCEDFLDTLPAVKIVEKPDTAMSAKWIAENHLAAHAAVCSKDAAEEYGLEVLAEAIETNPHNYTRFLLVSGLELAKQFFLETQHRPNKASLVFTLPHTVGNLAAVLTILSFYSINLTKLQSFPLQGKEWQYYFYADCAFKEHSRYKQALNAILPLTHDLKILGEYEACD
ncbi:MAG: prephenate dehydratase [Planctomycetaceae bacterium]|jgi:prephenate dehydratase|nr:prephenate dehydratase [Planctomycetaceae bacterium]